MNPLQQKHACQKSSKLVTEMKKVNIDLLLLSNSNYAFKVFTTFKKK